MKHLKNTFAGVGPVGAVLGLTTLVLALSAPMTPASAADFAQRCDAVAAPRSVSACARQNYYRRHHYQGPQVYYGPPAAPPVVYEEPAPYYYGPGNGYAPYYEGQPFFYRPYYNSNPFYGFGFRSW